MPPSPATGCSPRRATKPDNHRRGRSLEGGIIFREKDDDLALFNEMQTKETDGFLLQSNDDFEDMFSTKLRYFSDFKHGISVPVRGESSDLLNAEAEKTDYDWLLTPPETPLFPSLDDETPPVNLAQRGRPRSNPISFSRSSTMEKSYRSSRGSPSPNRLSPSPRSGSSTCQPRGRSSIVPHSSPTPTVRHASPSRRHSPPQSKPSTPAPRSSTPTPGRMSTGSSGTVSSATVRGVSPVKTSRGNSASPKVRAWQSNIPGFSLEAPPNLRTSLADRPASYVRGSSPASRNGRHSMSPTASRSVSSSFSHDRDRFSSHSKGSVASSGDDDIDSLQSVTVSSSERSTSRKVGAYQSNKGLGLSKKPNRTVHSTSAPKRSFDSALRQMDHRKGPQNMFRPLLSSVPSSTFYIGKASAASRVMVSRNSSVTTSSNASSDQGTTGAHDAEGSDQNQYDMVSEFGKEPYPDVQDKALVFDKVDNVNKDNGHVITDGPPDIWRSDVNAVVTADSQLEGNKSSSHHNIDTVISSIAASVDIKNGISRASSLRNIVLCSNCGHQFSAIELVEEDLKLCPDCRGAEILSSITTPETVVILAKNSPSLSKNLSEEYKSFDDVVPLSEVAESQNINDMGVRRVIQHEQHMTVGETSQIESSNFLSESSILQSLSEECVQSLANQKVMDQSTSDCTPPFGDIGGQQLQCFSEHADVKVDIPDGAGISILLKRSSSGKGSVVQGMTLPATNISYEALSYIMGNSTNSTRGSTGQGSASASSSMDLGSVRMTEIRVQRQLSGKKSDMENYRYDTKPKHHNNGSSLSGTSGHETLVLATSTHEQTSEVSVSRAENDAVNSVIASSQDQLLASETTLVDNMSTEVEFDDRFQVTMVSTSGCHTSNEKLVDCSSPLFSNLEDSVSQVNDDNMPNLARSASDVEASDATPHSSTVEGNTKLNSSLEEVPDPILLHAISDIEIGNGHSGSPDSQSHVVSIDSENSIDELHESYVVTSSDKETAAAVAESGPLDHHHGILEDSTISVGEHEGTNARNLIFEEATDTILFCSSIVHGIAYEAASIAIEKENLVPLEGSRPTVTILGKSTSDRKEPSTRTTGRRTFKSPKTRQRRLMTYTEPIPDNTENDEKTTEVSTTRMVGLSNKNDSMKPPPKLESKCNCTVM